VDKEVLKLFQWNDLLKKSLIWMVLIGILASLPLLYGRWMTERSADQVELVFDYSDLVVIASYQAEPSAFIKEQLDNLQQAGIHSMAIFESTLADLRWNNRLQLYNAKEAGLLTGQTRLNNNFTYLLFNSEREALALRPIIEHAFSSRDVSVSLWEANGLEGLRIEMAYEAAAILPMEPDPLTLEELNTYGFNPIVRLSNNRPFDPKEMDDLLLRLKSYGTKWIVFSGNEVTGYEAGNLETLGMTAELLNKHDMGFAVIEMIKTPQKGTNQLAYMTDYNVVRLHSLSERDSGNSPQVISDRLQLAVTDRDIRMIYLNAEVRRDVEKAVYKHTLANLYDSLKGDKGAISRIQAAGYELGQAQAFQVKDIAGERLLKAVILIGAIALITLLIAQFLPRLSFIVFVLGVLGSGALYVLSSSLLSQALALGAAISAPTLGVIWAINRVKRDQTAGLGFHMGRAIWTFLIASIISLTGSFFIIGLLNQVTYMLVLEQFRGVSLLHLAPIALIIVYLYFFSEGLSARAVYKRTISLLQANIKVFWVILAGLGGISILYYLSRTGNAGQASSIEMSFRAFLENTLGVRPRTKEFLLSHPLFLFALYFAVKYKHLLYLAIVGVIGQLSMVDTFAHIHSPISVSLIRGLLGLALGIVIGVILIMGCKWVIRSWKRWVPPLNV
jgi:hypothetical protein